MVKEPTDLAIERRVLQILAEVLDVPADERAQLLAERTVGDKELRLRVAKLVDHEADGELGRMTDLPGVADFEPLAEQPAVEGRVGSYEILRPVARGGMGWVFEAIQDEPRRRVALKMLRLGLDSDSARRRFRLESEVLGRLRHPGIAQVFEAGTHREMSALGEREIPFFALEYVEDARTIVDFARERELSHEQQIDLFLEVCDAVHYGHGMGIVHRDLKPANILVDVDGRPKVIDFGVARVLTREVGTTTRETLPGQIVGTVQYMSPEQLEADESELDARSDVYSLGVLLYELLCGQLPFDVGEKPIAAVVLTILDTPPPRPCRIQPGLSPDLEAILLCALEKNRERRYESAAALADDLRRFRRHEPIEATTPGFLHRARLLAHRNRIAVSGFVAVLVVLLGGIGASAFFARKSDVAQGMASTFEDALIQFNEDITSELLTELTNSGVSAETRVSILRKATARLESMAEGATDPEVRTSLGAAYVRLAGILGNEAQPNLRQTEEALLAYDRSDELLMAVLTQDPEAHRAAYYLARGGLGRASMARLEGETEKAVAHMTEARELLEKHVDEKDVRELLAVVLYESLRDMHGDHERMLSTLERASQLWSETSGTDAQDMGVRHGRAMCAGTRGSILLALDRHEEALGDLETGYELHLGLLDDSPGNRARISNFVGVARDLSRALLHAEEFDEALRVAESGIEVSAPLLLGGESVSVGQKAVLIRTQYVRALLARLRSADPTSAQFEEDLNSAAIQLETSEEELGTIPSTPAPPWWASVERQLSELRRELDRTAARASDGVAESE